MTVFGAIGVAGSGLTVYRKWLDAVSDNLANVSTVRSSNEAAYQAKYVVASEIPTANGGGVQVAGIELGDAEGRMVYEPDHPLADEGGYVRYPDIDMSSQMSQLIMAQRGYQASVQVTKFAQDSYSNALQIGAQ